MVIGFSENFCSGAVEFLRLAILLKAITLRRLTPRPPHQAFRCPKVPKSSFVLQIKIVFSNLGLYSRPVSQMLGVNCCSLGGVSRSTPPWFLLVPKGNQRKPRETIKCQGKPRNTKENHGKSSNTKENQREPRKIKGNQGKPRKTKENQWKPRIIREKQRTNQ